MCKNDLCVFQIGLKVTGAIVTTIGSMRTVTIDSSCECYYVIFDKNNKSLVGNPSVVEYDSRPHSPDSMIIVRIPVTEPLSCFNLRLLRASRDTFRCFRNNQEAS